MTVDLSLPIKIKTRIYKFLGIKVHIFTNTETKVRASVVEHTDRSLNIVDEHHIEIYNGSDWDEAVWVILQLLGLDDR